MKYKETVASGYVHGTISTTEDAPASNAVVLHKGVPYLIRPNLKTQIINGETVITGTRQFDIIKDIYHTGYPRGLDDHWRGIGQPQKDKQKASSLDA